MGKSRVAPLKYVSMPKMELMKLILKKLFGQIAKWYWGILGMT